MAADKTAVLLEVIHPDKGTCKKMYAQFGITLVHRSFII